MRKLTLIIAVLLSFGGARQSFADILSEDFESVTLVDADGNPLANAWSFGAGLSNGWKVIDGNIYTSEDAADYGIWTKAHTGTHSLVAAYGSTNNAFVVIPEQLTGKISFWARKTSSNSSTKGTVNIFEVVEEEGTYTKVSTLYTNSALTTTWTEYSFDLGDGGTLIAINLVRAAIDDVQAETFENTGTIVEKKALSITEAVSAMEGTKLEADDDNHITLAFDVTLRNMGNVTLAPGEENYTLSILNISNDAKEELVTIPVNETIEAGETRTISLQTEVTVPESLNGTRRRFSIRENLRGTSYSVDGYFTITAHLPRFAVYDEEPTAYSTSMTSNDGIYSFGNVATDFARTFYIRNSGNAPLHVNDITAPEGFSVTPTATTVAPWENAIITVTLHPDAENYGAKSGAVVITSEGFEPFIINVSGTTRDPDLFFIDFNDQVIPDNWSVGALWQIDFATYGSTDFYLSSYKYGVTEASPLVTPMLTVDEGERMTIHAARYGDYSTPILQISYSSDQTTWTSLINLSSKLTIDFAEFELPTIPPGNWYIRFQGLNVLIDNVFGFRVYKDGQEDGIKAIGNNDSTRKQSVYDLSGRTLRTNHSPKGVHVIGGKKVLRN